LNAQRTVARKVCLHYYLGQAQAEAGHKAEALAEFKRAAALQSGFPPLQYKVEQLLGGHTSADDKPPGDP